MFYPRNFFFFSFDTSESSRINAQVSRKGVRYARLGLNRIEYIPRKWWNLESSAFPTVKYRPTYRARAYSIALLRLLFRIGSWIVFWSRADADRGYKLNCFRVRLCIIDGKICWDDLRIFIARVTVKVEFSLLSYRDIIIILSNICKLIRNEKF